MAVAAPTTAAVRNHSGRRWAIQMPDSMAEEMKPVAAQAEEQARQQGLAWRAKSRWRKAGHIVVATGRLLGMRGAC